MMQVASRFTLASSSATAAASACPLRRGRRQDIGIAALFRAENQELLTLGDPFGIHENRHTYLFGMGRLGAANVD